MDLLKKLTNAPNELFDYVMDCEHEGFVPSNEDMIDKFGSQYEEWKDLFPESRYSLLEEQWSEPVDELKDRGLNLLRDFL